MHQLVAQFLVAHFPATKLELEFYLVPLVEELLSVADLYHVVMRINIYPKLDLFELGTRRPSIFILLGEIVAVFAEIDNFADGRISCRSNFYEIEPQRLSSSQGVLQFHDT